MGWQKNGGINLRSQLWKQTSWTQESRLQPPQEYAWGKPTPGGWIPRRPLQRPRRLSPPHQPHRRRRRRLSRSRRRSLCLHLGSAVVLCRVKVDGTIPSCWFRTLTWSTPLSTPCNHHTRYNSTGIRSKTKSFRSECQFWAEDL